LLNIESLLAPANSTNTEAHPSQGHLISIDTCTTPYDTRNLAGRTLLANQKRKLQQTGELSETGLWSEALIIYGIHEYNRRIHEYPYVFMKFKEIIVTSPVL
jgi:hypothetical protein